MMHPSSRNLIKQLYSSIGFLFCLLFLASCQQKTINGQLPQAKNGVLDLRNWDFGKDGTIPLNGEWTFYWQELLEPDDFATTKKPEITGHLNLPGRWNGYKARNSEIPGNGFATFRLHVKVNSTTRPFALKILDMSTAYSLWANGRLLSSNGRVGKSKQESSPQFLPNVSSFLTETGDIFLTLQVSNFRHRKGGVWEPIEFGFENDIRAKRTGYLSFELFLIGSLLVMSFYHFGLFVLRRSDRSTIYFSLVCFLIALRTLFVGERFFIWLFPDFNWEVFQKMEYISFYLSIPFFYLFISSLFSEFSQKAGRVLVVISLLFSAFTLGTPTIIFSYGMPVYQIMLVVFCLYTPYALAKAILNRSEGAMLVSSGLFILLATVFYEILATNEFVYNINLSPVGLFVFIFVQSVMLSMRFSKAFTMSEILSEELENKVEERTRGLKQAHEELVSANMKLKETQDQLVQSQKMEAMGTLAGGIAHEFNNILGTIVGYSEMLTDEVESEGVVKEGLNAISQSGHRAADLVRQILTFSRVDSRELSPMYIQSSIEDMLKVIKKTLPESVTLDTKIQIDCNPIMANKTQISQVLLNLCTNAVDAMKPGGGVLKIELTEKTIQNESTHDELSAESYLELSVADSGMGMTDDIKSRIFDPFYTTKEVNEGTGLGLSIVHGIVKGHLGSISVNSTPAKGSVFKVLFPVTTKKPVDIRKEKIEPKKGKGHILIVEDEKDLLNLYRVMLKKLGYQSSIFFDGIEALKSFKAQPDQYDLVFTDQMMPKLTGFDMSQEILKIRPEIPIIIATGHSPTVSLEEAKKAGIKDFMTKPVRFSTLSHKLSELI